MVFFTKKLFDRINGPNIRTARRSLIQWQRNGALYKRYFDLIAEFLPAALRRLNTNTLHDSVVLGIKKRLDVVTIKLRGNDVLGGWRKRTVVLQFSGTLRATIPRTIVGKRWNHDEAHLASDNRFRFCASFSNGADHAEVEIEARGLRIFVKR